MSEELVASVSSLLRNRKKARELISAKLTGLVLRDDPHHTHRLKKETISKTYSAKLQAQLREPDPRALHLQNRSLLSLEPNPIDLEHMFFAAPLDRVLIWSNEILTSRVCFCDQDLFFARFFAAPRKPQVTVSTLEAKKLTGHDREKMSFVKACYY
ncbi:hypothetical protein DY000_02002373 [Brassica cretica]|uniref:Uncharacterized protein n=1 Tax=Brassica cretica TaxID=69181 RepID=A0ABQ7BWX2_BRACR|nr:hypothetical protein DY000_02002373 [Brassica cretica]